MADPRTNRTKNPITADIHDLIAANPERAQQAEDYARRISMHLIRGNFPAASRVISEAEFYMEVQPEKFGQRSLHDVGISVRTCNMLNDRHSATTVADLRHVRTERLLTTENVNVKTIDEIWQCVLAAVLRESKEL